MTGCVSMFASVVSACLLSSLAHADAWHSSKIKQLYPQADGNFILILETDSTQCSSASNPDDYSVWVGQNGMTQEGSKKTFAAASIAFAMGKTINIVFDESTPNCFINPISLVD